MNNVAITINDRREIDGTSNLSGDTTTHAVLWRNRAITDLRTLPGDVSSAVNGMNNKGQVVGDSYSGRRGCDCRFAVVRAASALAHPSIDIVASNWKFTPNTFELYVGETATLRMTSKKASTGSNPDELGIPLTAIEPGSFKTVQVTPKQPGKYVLHCAIMCGAAHANMTLTVNVVP